jgi:hypothetical protein
MEPLQPAVSEQALKFFGDLSIKKAGSPGIF